MDPQEEDFDEAECCMNASQASEAKEPGNNRAYENHDENLREIAHVDEQDDIIHVTKKQQVSILRATQVLRNYHDMDMVKRE